MGPWQGPSASSGAARAGPSTRSAPSACLSREKRMKAHGVSLLIPGTTTFALQGRTEPEKPCKALEGGPLQNLPARGFRQRRKPLCAALGRRAPASSDHQGDDVLRRVQSSRAGELLSSPLSSLEPGSFLDQDDHLYDGLLILRLLEQGSPGDPRKCWQLSFEAPVSSSF